MGIAREIISERSQVQRSQFRQELLALIGKGRKFSLSVKRVDRGKNHSGLYLGRRRTIIKLGWIKTTAVNIKDDRLILEEGTPIGGTEDA